MCPFPIPPLLENQSCYEFDAARRYVLFFIAARIRVNLLPHRVLVTFFLRAGGLIWPPEEGDISREKTILMTSL